MNQLNFKKNKKIKISFIDLLLLSPISLGMLCVHFVYLKILKNFFFDPLVFQESVVEFPHICEFSRCPPVIDF